MNPSGSSPWMHTRGGNRTSSRRRPPASARSTSLRPNGLILNSSGPKPSQSADVEHWILSGQLPSMTRRRVRADGEEEDELHRDVLRRGARVTGQ